MKTSEIMTSDPACCKENQSLQDAARLMIDNDCGQIPVVDDEGGLVGVITDRDVCCRAVAEGMSAETRVGDVMTRSVVSVTPDTSLEDCLASTMTGNAAAWFRKPMSPVPVTMQRRPSSCRKFPSHAQMGNPPAVVRATIYSSRSLKGGGCRLLRTEVEHLPAIKSKALPWTSVSF